METSDRRRLRFSEQCLCDSEESSFSAHLQDLSINGAYIAASNPFPVGHKFRLRFPLNGKWIATTCAVRHVNPGTGMGVQFLALPKEQGAWLGRHFGRLLDRLGGTAFARKRTASRISACIPITVNGFDQVGRPFEEETETLNVSERGACVRLRRQVLSGSIVRVRATLGAQGRPADFRVVWVGAPKTQLQGQIGLAPTVRDLWRSWNGNNSHELESEKFLSEFQPHHRDRF